MQSNWIKKCADSWFEKKFSPLKEIGLYKDSAYEITKDKVCRVQYDLHSRQVFLVTPHEITICNLD